MMSHFNPLRRIESLKNRALNRRTRNRVFTISCQPPARGRVLLSYLAWVADLEERQKYHSSYWECWEMAYIWRDLGFDVDLISHGNLSFTPRHAYDVCIDIHSNLERLAPLLPPRCIKILHITGAHWIYQNAAEYSRLLALQERRGITLTPRRIVPPSLGIQACDCATYLGNEFTASTFAFAAKPMTRIPLSSRFRAPWPESKNWDAARSRFLWMASMGNVLRGLDVVLEAFAKLPHLQLDVCGLVREETDFFAAYERELMHLPNIHYHSAVDLEAEPFARIAAKCGSIIYPSASEGGAGSVISAAHAALVPLVPRSASIDIGNTNMSNGVFLLPDISVEAVREAVEMVASWPPEELESRARNVWEWANTHHTREIFTRRYREFAQSVVENLEAIEHTN